MIIANNKQLGSDEKLAQALITLSNCKNPPAPMMLGKDTLDIFRDKISTMEKEIAEWHDITTGTDHDDVCS